MTEIASTEAIVLKVRRLPGADNIITIFTKEKGKLSLLAKGVKKVTSRRSPHLQTGNLIRIIYSQKREFKYIQETNLISGFSATREDMRKTSILYSFFFVLEKLLPEEQVEPGVYRTARGFLIELGKSENAAFPMYLTYLNELMMAFGYVEKPLSFEELRRTIEEIMNEKMPIPVI